MDHVNSKHLESIKFYIFFIFLIMFSQSLSEALYLLSSRTKISPAGVFYQIEEIEGKKFIVQQDSGHRIIVGDMK